jgi:putative membrane protein
MRPFLPVFVLAAAALAGCAREGAAPDAVSGKAATARDAYVQAAALSDQYEIQSSQLARSRAQRPEVRDYAQMMIDHHTQSTEQLWAAARAAGMVRTHVWMLPPEGVKMMEDLGKAYGADFDRLYLRQQVQAHEAALALHGGYAANGDAPALRAVAAAAVPVVTQHLERARALD